MIWYLFLYNRPGARHACCSHCGLGNQVCHPLDYLSGMPQGRHRMDLREPFWNQLRRFPWRHRSSWRMKTHGWGWETKSSTLLLWDLLLPCTLGLLQSLPPPVPRARPSCGQRSSWCFWCKRLFWWTRDLYRTGRKFRSRHQTNRRFHVLQSQWWI